MSSDHGGAQFETRDSVQQFESDGRVHLEAFLFGGGEFGASVNSLDGVRVESNAANLGQHGGDLVAPGIAESKMLDHVLHGVMDA